MIDPKKANELINQYFSSKNKAQIIKDLQEYECDFSKLAAKDLEEKKNVLVDLIIKHKAYDIKDGAGFDLECQPEKSCFYIRLLEIFEKGQGIKLSRIIASDIEQLIVPIDRVIGLLSQNNAGEELTNERYHLAPTIANIIEKSSCELISLKDKDSGKYKFIKDGRLLPKERVVIVDEVLTTGTNIIDAVNYIRQYYDSVNVTDAFVFITRATENKLKDIENKLKKLKINLHYIINIKELLEKLEQQECLTPQELEIIKSEQSKS